MVNRSFDNQMEAKSEASVAVAIDGCFYWSDGRMLQVAANRANTRAEAEGSGDCEAVVNLMIFFVEIILHGPRFNFENLSIMV
ncbi:hypothetical protein ACFX11_020368 [Malus domestica]